MSTDPNVDQQAAARMVGAVEFMHKLRADPAIPLEIVEVIEDDLQEYLEGIEL